MAELSGSGARTGTAPVASQQFVAIAWLRWRILANGFRRKGGAGELIARILLMPVFAALALLPTAAAGVLSFLFAGRGNLGYIVWILWGAVALTQLLNINLSQPGTTFDPTELIRFPMPLRRYIAVRLCFGLLSPANIIVTLISLAVFIGVSIARPHLLIPAAIVMFVFALTNVLFTRMIFAWVDRWLSTRRAREIFTAFIFLFSLGIQYANVRFNPGFEHNHQRRHRRSAPDLRPMQKVAHRVHPYIAWLPPELTSAAINSASQNRPVLFLADTAACACFAVLFLGVYGLRMRTEFRGEVLSDVANATRAKAPPVPKTQPVSVPAAPLSASPSAPAKKLLPSTLVPLLSKELLVLRRNIGLLYGLIVPVVMVLLFAGRVSARNGSHWVLLAAVAYALLGISPMSYNSFGTEGTGAQLYFFAPVSLREVFFAKNVFTTLLAVVEVIAVVAVTSYVAGRPSPMDCVFAILWAIGTLLLNTTLGNLRSVSAPKVVAPGRTMRRAQNQVSAYIAMGILFACAGFGFACQVAAGYLHRAWLASAVMLVFVAGATIAYMRGLRGIESYTLDRRDTLLEELGKKR